MITLQDKWKEYTRDFVSPDSYIEWSFYSMIASALQRRVYAAHANVPIFSNIYTILVGPPATGKSLVIKQVASILKHHQYRNPRLNGKDHSEEDDEAQDQQREESIRAANQMLMEVTGNRQAPIRNNGRQLLIPVGAEATTFEALTGALARSGRVHYYHEQIDGKLVEKNTPLSCAIAFCLEEISSLFRKHTEDVSNFLLVTYDCGDYTYDTKTKNITIIKKCCVNMLGGTTPTFMRTVFNDDILTDGFASRSFFIYETQPRFYKFYLPDFTTEQLQYKQDILDLVKKLTTLHGRLKLTPDADAYFKDWWEVHQGKRTNNNPKLDHYYGRKNLHAMKIAMILHFADSTEMTMGIEPCQRALQVLERAEMNMHMALMFSTKNPLSHVTKLVQRYVEDNPGCSKEELLVNFYEECQHPTEDIDTIVSYLLTSRKIKPVGTPNGPGYQIKE